MYVFAIVTALIVSASIAQGVLADSASLWSNDATVEITKLNSGIHEIHQTSNGAKCEPKIVTVGVYPRFPYVGLPHDEKVQSCLVSTAYGFIDPDKQILIPKYSTRGGALSVSSAPSQGTFIPTSHSEKAFAISGRHLLIYDDIDTFLTRTDTPVNGKEYVYYPKSGYDHQVLQSSGQPMQFRMVSFSADGRWAVGVEYQRNVLVKINLETRNVTAVGSHYPLGIRSPYMTISNSGRYIATTTDQSGQDAMLRIIDTTTCGTPNLDDNLQIVNGCSGTNLTNVLKSEVGDYDSIHAPEFSSDASTLSVTIGSNGASSEIALTAEGHEYSSLDYLALGDSFSSGEGDLNGELYYKSGTDVAPTELIPQGEKCHVSSRSYPFLVSVQLGISPGRMQSVACSGAMIGDVYGDGKYVGQENRLQRVSDTGELDNYNNDSKERYIPGRVRQFEFVEKFKPKIITVTIGGNNLDFANVIKSCASSITTCRYASSVSERSKKAREAIRLIDDLNRLYAEINTASPSTKVYVLGYPKFISDKSKCDLNVQLDESERQFINASVELLNRAIETATVRAGVVFIDIEDSISSYGLCSGADPIFVNGLSGGDDVGLQFGGFEYNFIGQESYHPNQYGHEHMALGLMNEVSLLGENANTNLLTYNHCENGLVICPSAALDPEISEYFGGSQPVGNVIYEPYLLHENSIQAGTTAELKVNDLLPGSEVEVYLHSDPVFIGSFSTGIRGDLNANILIPDSVKAGYHTIRFSATAISGEQIELYDSLQVIHSEADVDGNQINDTEQLCILVKYSGRDSDADNVDDACDLHIAGIGSSVSNKKNQDEFNQPMTRIVEKSSEPADLSSVPAESVAPADANMLFQTVDPTTKEYLRKDVRISADKDDSLESIFSGTSERSSSGYVGVWLVAVVLMLAVGYYIYHKQLVTKQMRYQLEI